MYTRCPDCRTWFSVTEAHLAAARARVRCGQCLATFDASSYLWSEPDENSAPGAMACVRGRAAPQGIGRSRDDSRVRSVRSVFSRRLLRIAPMIHRFLEHDYARPEDPSRGRSGSLLRFPRGGRHRRGSRDGVARPSGGRRPSRLGRGSPGSSGSGSNHEGRVSTRRRRSREQEILSRIEGMDVRRGRRLAANSCIVLLLLLVLQYTWFMAGSWPQRSPCSARLSMSSATWPDARPRRGAVRKGSASCPARCARHPEYTSAFSVKATLENRATEARPFPVVVFVLYGRTADPCEPSIRTGRVPRKWCGTGRRTGFGQPREPSHSTSSLRTEVAVSFDLRLI